MKFAAGLLFLSPPRRERTGWEVRICGAGTTRKRGMSVSPRFDVSNSKPSLRVPAMNRESISLRATAVSIVYGWLFLLAFALAASSIRAKAHAGAPPVHKTFLAPAPVDRH